jgi:hypothetical protein
MKTKGLLFQARLHQDPYWQKFQGEGLALDILNACRQNGLSDRQILVEALVSMAGKKVPRPSENSMVKELGRLMNDMRDMIRTLSELDLSQAVYIEGDKAGQAVDFSPLQKIMDNLPGRRSFEED